MKRKRSIPNLENTSKMSFKILILAQHLHFIYDFLPTDSFLTLQLVCRIFYQKTQSQSFKIAYLQLKFGSLRGLFHFKFFVALQAHCWMGKSVHTKSIRFFSSKGEAVKNIKNMLIDIRRIFLVDNETFSRNLNSFDVWKGDELKTTYDELPAFMYEGTLPKCVYSIFGKKLEIRASNEFRRKYKMLKLKDKVFKFEKSKFDEDIISKILDYIPVEDYFKYISINSHWYNAIIDEDLWKRKLIQKYGDLTNALFFPIYMVFEMFSRLSKGNYVSNIEVFESENLTKQYIQDLIEKLNKRRPFDRSPYFEERWNNIECQYNIVSHLETQEYYLSNYYKTENYLTSKFERVYFK